MVASSYEETDRVSHACCESRASTRGFGLHLPFFWAISENRDATFVLDAYSKVGIGEGMEYRFVEPGDVKGYCVGVSYQGF